MNTQPAAINMKLDEQQHKGAVTSRIHETCLVIDPMVIIIDGTVTELSVLDAEALRDGLAAAIARVRQSETALKGDGSSWSLATLGNLAQACRSSSVRSSAMAPFSLALSWFHLFCEVGDCYETHAYRNS